ncbi:MAG TPA: hypothetical protein VEG35_00875, partial [Burkholderiales bacterium]|nr:hypothetical protein [Burkholderiales bacterium]
AMIAEAAEGSMRDAQSLLDQAVAFSGQNISDDDLKTILGTIGQDILFRFSTAVLEERPQDIFALVDDLIASGYDLRFFFGKLIGHFRDLLLVSSVDRPEDYLALTGEELETLRSLAAKANAEDFLRYLVALQQGEQGLRYSTQPRIYVETFLIRLCQFRKIVPLKELLQDLESLTKAGGNPRPGEPRPGLGPAKPSSFIPSPASAPHSVRPAAAGSWPRSAPAAAPAPSAKPPAPSVHKETFSRILERLAKERAPLAALLAQNSSVRIRDDLIEVFFERGKGFFGTTIQDKDIKAVENAAREVLGRELTVQFAEEGPPPREPIRPAPGREVDTALKDPAVQYFMNTFKAQILSADPVKAAKDKEPKGFGPGEGEA